MRSLIVLLALFVAGCSAMAPITDRVVEGIDEYCKRTDELERSYIRNEINTALQSRGHKVKVDCYDPNTESYF